MDWRAIVCVLIVVINTALARDFDLSNWEVATNTQDLVADESIMQQLPEDSFAFQEALVSVFALETFLHVSDEVVLFWGF